jgi:hypothetical protein
MIFNLTIIDYFKIATTEDFECCQQLRIYGLDESKRKLLAIFENKEDVHNICWES